MAVMLATSTGMKLRGFHSNSSNSTESSTAAIGVPNTAVMPAAAPATSVASAWVLLRLIGLVTNLAYHGHRSSAD